MFPQPAAQHASSCGTHVIPQERSLAAGDERSESPVAGTQEGRTLTTGWAASAARVRRTARDRVGDRLWWALTSGFGVPIVAPC